MQLSSTIKSYLKQKSIFILLIGSLIGLTSLATSCGSPKTGCPVNERAKTKINKKGELSGRKGKSNLFPKKVRKKMRTK